MHGQLKKNPTISPEEIVLRLRSEFLTEATETLGNIDLVLNQFYSSSITGEQATRDIRQEAHNLKGMAATFGFPIITSIMHRLEDYLELTPLVEKDDMNSTQRFINLADQIVESGENPDPATSKALLRELPDTTENTETDRHKSFSDMLVMLIVHSKTIGLKIKHELSDYGFDVCIEANTIDVIPRIVRKKPDFVISSYSMDGLNGVDLVRAIVSMTTTSHIPVALLTSLDKYAKELENLPKKVPVIRLGADVDAELAKALTALEFRWPVA